MLFSFVARGVRALQQWPRLVLIVNVVVCLALLWPIGHMKWRIALADLLPENTPSRLVSKEIEQKFGGFGTLTIVVHSSDSLANSTLIHHLAREFQKSSLVNFTEYETEANFYIKHQFLYIRLADLESIRDRIRNHIDIIKNKRNPLLVTLDSTMTLDTAITPLSLADLEQKYLKSLRPYIGNADGTIQVLEVYPSQPISNLEKDRALTTLAKELVQQLNPQRQLQVEYTGKVFEQASTGGMLLLEVYHIGWISAAIILLFLILWFYRHPQIPLVAAIPVGTSMIWTIGFNAVWFGSMNFFTLILCLVIPGFAAHHLTHFLSHYADERRRGLGPDLALESTVLGTGPVITVVSIASAIAFFSLTLLPLQGLRQLGIVGGLGVIFNWASIVLLVPILLTILQRKHRFRLFRNTPIQDPILRQIGSQNWMRLLPVLAIITLLLASQGMWPHFEYDFSKLQYLKPAQKANELLEKIGIPNQEPAVVLTRDRNESKRLLDYLRSQTPNDSTRTIERVVNFASLLPPDQEKKIELLHEIHALLTPDVLENLPSDDSAAVRKVMGNWDVTPVTENELPLTYRRKFMGRDSSYGEFTFIFPAINVNDGRECRRFSHDVGSIRLDDSTVLHATSNAIIRADILDQSLPWMTKTFLAMIVGILVLVLVYERRPYRVLFVIVPPAIGFLWLLSILRLLQIPINPFSVQIFPMLIGISISGSQHLWYQYRERSTGSVIAVLRRTGPVVSVATLVLIICFSGLLFSSHPGFRSMGLVAVLGLVCQLLATLTLFPVLVGWLDWYRFRKRKYHISKDQS